MLLQTPKNKLTILLLAVFLYATAPFIEWLALSNLLSSGRLPVDADSIGIGWFFFFVGWFVSAPFVSGFFFWALRDYPPQVRIFAFNRERPVWTFAWWTWFAFLFFEFLLSAAVHCSDNFFIGFIQYLLLAYLTLLLYAAVRTKKPMSREKKQAIWQFVVSKEFVLALVQIVIFSFLQHIILELAVYFGAKRHPRGGVGWGLKTIYLWWFYVGICFVCSYLAIHFTKDRKILTQFVGFLFYASFFINDLFDASGWSHPHRAGLLVFCAFIGLILPYFILRNKFIEFERKVGEKWVAS